MKLSIVTALIFLVTIGAQQTFADQHCIFGEDLGELGENPRFNIQYDVIKTFKAMRPFESENRLVMVSLSVIKDLKTGREFHLNTTFRHHDDGDNTIGWIEEVTGAADNDSGVENEGQVVVEIGDSFFDECILRE